MGYTGIMCVYIYIYISMYDMCTYIYTHCIYIYLYMYDYRTNNIISANGDYTGIQRT